MAGVQCLRLHKAWEYTQPLPSIPLASQGRNHEDCGCANINTFLKDCVLDATPGLRFITHTFLPYLTCRHL